MSKVKTLEEMEDMKATWRLVCSLSSHVIVANVYLLEDNSCCDMLQVIYIYLVQIIFVGPGPNFRPVQSPNLYNSLKILRSYDMHTAHVESMSADPTHDQAKAKGYLTKMTTFKFVVHLVFIVDLLLPLSKLSLAWQKDATEIPHMLAAELAMKAALARLRVAEDDETALSKLVEMGTPGTASYKGVSLTRVEQGTSFFTSR